MTKIYIRPAKPRSSGYCHHCATRQCIWPACEDIAKARKAGYSDQDIIKFLKSQGRTA